MMVSYGEETVPRKMIPLPREYLMSANSVPGSLYEIDVKLKNKADYESAKKLISVLPKEFKRRFNAEVKYIEVTDDTVRIQLEGSPFAWAAVIAFLPEIFMFAGLLISLASVFLIISKAPWEAFAFMVGLILLASGYYMGKGRAKVVGRVERVTEEVM